MNALEDAPQVRLEYITCCLCGSTEHETVYVIDLNSVRLSAMWHERTRIPINQPMHIVKCVSCGLVFVNPRVAFDERLTPYDRNTETIYFERTRSARRIAALNLLDCIHSIVTSGKWLDIGCGDGTLMEEARDRSYEVYGTEVSKSLIEQLRLKFGPNRILSHDLSLLPSAHFDVITMISVLEHVHAPLDMLADARRALKPSGILAVEVPNIESLKARMRGQSWDQIEPLGHLYYFSNQTLCALLSKAGFKVIGRFAFTGKVDLSSGLRPIKRLVAAAYARLSSCLALLAVPQ